MKSSTQEPRIPENEDGCTELRSGADGDSGNRAVMGIRKNVPAGVTLLIDFWTQNPRPVRGAPVRPFLNMRWREKALI